MCRHRLEMLAPSLLAICLFACGRPDGTSSDTVSRRQPRPDAAPARGIIGAVVSDSPPTVRVQADSERRTPPNPVGVTKGSDGPPEAEPTADFATIGEACDSVSATLSRRLREPLSLRSDDAPLAETFSRDAVQRGCVLTWKGTFARTPDVGGEASGAFTAAGWAPVTHMQADGPDGTVFGMVSITALCIVQGEWDGGDDADSTHVAGDWWRLRVECGDDVQKAAEPGGSRYPPRGR